MATKPTNSLSLFMRAVPVFGGLEGRSLARVVSVLDKHTFKAGTTIFSEGELGRSMYIIRDGEVEVSRANAAGKNVPIVRLGAGECFGEMTLVELQPRSATITVRKTCQAYSMTNMDLYNLYKDDNYAYVIVLQNISRMLSRRLRKADSRIAEFLSSNRAGRRARSR